MSNANKQARSRSHCYMYIQDRTDRRTPSTPSTPLIFDYSVRVPVDPVLLLLVTHPPVLYKYATTLGYYRVYLARDRTCLMKKSEKSNGTNTLLPTYLGGKQHAPQQPCSHIIILEVRKYDAADGSHGGTATLSTPHKNPSRQNDRRCVTP